MSERHAKGHWRCGSCGAWCDCTDEMALRMPHVPCGVSANVGPEWEAVGFPPTLDEATLFTEAVKRWQAAHARMTPR